MLTAATAARLEIIQKYSPSYSAMISDFGQSVVDDLSNKGLISDEDKEHCTLTAYGLSELSKYHAENPVEPPKEPPKDSPKETQRRRKEPSASEKHRMPIFWYKSDIVTLLYFFDTNDISYDFFITYALKDKVEKLLAYRLISEEDGICRLTDRGRAILEKSIEKNLLHENSYHFSFFSCLCAALMTLILVLQLISFSVDFGEDFYKTVLLVPRNLCIGVGTILYWFSVGIGNRKFSFASVVVFVSAYLVWPDYILGLGCALVLLFGIIGYVRSGRS